MNLFLKRFFDICVSCFLLVILSPIFLVLSIWIKCDSPGTVFFCQERRTKDGIIFNMYKFRSMCMNAEKTGAGLFNYENDPRVTRVGAFLRKTSLDELPQLWNVLKGHISLVGPRPCVTYELGDFDTLNKKYKKRFQMKAGITGLAQVRGRNDISWDEKVLLDNEYIDRFKGEGIFLDMCILFETVINVFKRDNIYETKSDETMSGEEAAEAEFARIVRLAHLPDEE